MLHVPCGRVSSRGRVSVLIRLKDVHVAVVPIELNRITIIQISPTQLRILRSGESKMLRHQEDIVEHVTLRRTVVFVALKFLCPVGAPFI